MALEQQSKIGGGGRRGLARRRRAAIFATTTVPAAPVASPSLSGHPTQTPIPAAYHQESANSHIRIIPRPAEPESSSYSDCGEKQTPVRTNPSYLVETQRILTSNQPEVFQSRSSPHTFAEMARLRIGARETGESMASNEPHPLTKFIKPSRGKGGNYWKESQCPTFLGTSHNSSPTRGSPEKSQHGTFASYWYDAKAPLLHYQHNDTTVGTERISALHHHMAAIPTVFGDSLPDPVYLSVTVGKRDGEMTFIIHPNGDISAHQWSVKEYHWQNVGQYSFNRKAVEGVLGSVELKGQKIGSHVPRNTLEYFLAIAKQYEETSISKASEPTGYELSNVRPLVRPVPAGSLVPSLHRPPLIVNTSGNRSMSFSSAGYNSQAANVPALQRLASSRRESLALSEERSRYSSPSHIIRAATSPLIRRKSVSPDLKCNLALNLRNNLPQTISDPLAYPDNTSVVNTSASYSNHQNAQPSGDRRLTRKKIFQEEQQRLQQQRPIINEDSDEDEDYLDHVSVSQTSPSLRRRSTANKTVTSQPYTRRATEREPSLGRSLMALTHTSNYASYPAYRNTTDVGPPTCSGSFPPCVDLRQSEAEGEHHTRQVRIISREHTANMSNEELMQYGRPTTQNWKGPFFTDGEDTSTLVDSLSTKENFNDWFTAATRFQREQEYLIHIKSACPWSNDGIDSTTLGIEQVLLPVRYNLMSYTDDRMKGDYFCRFVPPPAHCVDDTPKGRLSLFGESSGPPSPRRGRDPRYRSMQEGTIETSGFAVQDSQRYEGLET